MTSAEMHTAVNIELQQIDSFINDDFQPEEVDYYLNKAQEEIVREYAKVFEANEVAKSALNSVVAEQVLLVPIGADTFPTGDTNEKLINYPSDFWYFLSGECGITRTANPTIGSKSYVRMIPARNQDLDKIRITPFHNPYLRYPYVLQKEDFLHIFIDGETTLVDVKINYIRELVKIVYKITNAVEDNSDCELPDNLHQRVVDLAVNYMRRDMPSRTPALETPANI